MMASTVSTGQWTQRLSEHCAVRNLGEPRYQDVSDRRGGRTAWSTVVVVSGQQYSALFWYDVNHMDQAKQDAAEVAMRAMTGYTKSPAQNPPVYTTGA